MKIAVLISGGVDSAVVVHKLFNEGHDLHLYYIRIGMDTADPDDPHAGDCSAEEDLEMCRLIAHKYGLPLDVIPLHNEYWEHVMAYALDTVKKGLTPHPDMMCNKIIKFGYFEKIIGHKYDKTATGHYASIATGDDGRLYLATAADPVKDQTDFLAQISYEQLSHLMFPLGDLPKQEVRRIAAEAHLPNAARKDSQGICFLGKIDYNDFLRRHLGERPGPIIELKTGKKIGTHKGYWFHTIGQRKGLGLSGGPWYVVKKNVRDNAIYVANGFDTADQYGKRLKLTDMHWITSNPFDEKEADEIRLAFKNRHTPHFSPALMKRFTNAHGDLSYVIDSEEPVQGIAPGQFAIIYTPDCRLCLGSGMITL